MPPKACQCEKVFGGKRLRVETHSIGLFSILKSRRIFLGLGVFVRFELVWDLVVGLLTSGTVSKSSAAAYSEDKDMDGDRIGALWPG
ncbi:hypothetical protein PtrARCrB10_11598, partial [Pyrenophora tritici-repentis]